MVEEDEGDGADAGDEQCGPQHQVNFLTLAQQLLLVGLLFGLVVVVFGRRDVHGRRRFGEICAGAGRRPAKTRPPPLSPAPRFKVAP